MRIGYSIFSRATLRAAVCAVLIALYPSSLSAQNLTGHYDNWIVMADDSMALALTTDGEDTAFGLICGPQCSLFIESRIACVEGRDYRVTIEAGAASSAAAMTCKRADGGLLLVMPQDEQFLTLIASQDALSITIMRDGGVTSSYRFPLVGSEPAIGIALAARNFIKPLDAAGLAPDTGPPEPEKPR